MRRKFRNMRKYAKNKKYIYNLRKLNSNFGAGEDKGMGLKTPRNSNYPPLKKFKKNIYFIQKTSKKSEITAVTIPGKCNKYLERIQKNFQRK